MLEPSIKQAGMRPLYRIILWVLGVILVLLIALQIFLSVFADEYAASYIKDRVRKSTNDTYVLDFGDLDLNVFSGSVSIKNLTLQADTSAFSKKSAPPKSLFDGTIHQVDVSGVNVFSTFLGDKLSIGSISIDHPEITIRRNPYKVKTDSSENFSSVDSTIYAAISNRYRELELDHFSINNARAHVVASGDTLTSVDPLNLSLRNIRVDSASVQSGRKFITDDIKLDAGHVKTLLSDSLNTLALGGFSISSEDQTIALDSLQLIPRYPRFEFGRKKGVEIDRIDLTIPEIRFHGVYFSTFIDSAKFHSRFVEINKARMNDFRNKNLPFPPNNHPPLPHTALQNMKQQIKIDSLKINDAYIAYSEYWNKSPGKITLEPLNITIYNLTNYPAAIKNGESITMDARAMVMGKGLLTAHFDFPMDTKSGFHKVKGKLRSMNLTDFNPMLQYVAFVRIDRGSLNELTFDMTLNNTRSSGTVVMKYTDLKVSVLDKNSLKQRGILENLKTLAANKFVIRKNNTPEDGMRAGQISFERIQRKSVFNYWWKSLLSGIKSTISSL